MDDSALPSDRPLRMADSAPPPSPPGAAPRPIRQIKAASAAPVAASTTTMPLHAPVGASSAVTLGAASSSTCSSSPHGAGRGAEGFSSSLSNLSPSAAGLSSVGEVGAAPSGATADKPARIGSRRDMRCRASDAAAASLALTLDVVSAIKTSTLSVPSNSQRYLDAATTRRSLSELTSSRSTTRTLRMGEGPESWRRRTFGNTSQRGPPPIEEKILNPTWCAAALAAALAMAWQARLLEGCSLRGPACAYCPLHCPSHARSACSCLVCVRLCTPSQPRDVPFG